MLPRRTLTSLLGQASRCGRPSSNFAHATHTLKLQASTKTRSYSQHATLSKKTFVSSRSSTASLFALGLTATAVLASQLLATSTSNPLRLDADPVPKTTDTEEEAPYSPNGNYRDAAFKKEDISVICFIGGPAAGKSTQVDNVAKRFNLVKIDAKGDIKAQIQDSLSKRNDNNNNSQEKPRFVLENFPQTLDQATQFQSEICEILCILFIDLESNKAIDRLSNEIDKRDAKINWKRFEEKSKGLIKRFRFQGNFLEITGEWPANEVWEQVEAKLESALELDDRGEL